LYTYLEYRLISPSILRQVFNTAFVNQFEHLKTIKIMSVRLSKKVAIDVLERTKNSLTSAAKPLYTKHGSYTSIPWREF